MSWSWFLAWWGDHSLLEGPVFLVSMADTGQRSAPRLQRCPASPRALSALTVPLSRHRPLAVMTSDLGQFRHPAFTCGFRRKTSSAPTLLPGVRGHQFVICSADALTRLCLHQDVSSNDSCFQCETVTLTVISCFLSAFQASWVTSARI